MRARCVGLGYEEISVPTFRMMMRKSTFRKLLKVHLQGVAKLFKGGSCFAMGRFSKIPLRVIDKDDSQLPLKRVLLSVSSHSGHAKMQGLPTVVMCAHITARYPVQLRGATIHCSRLAKSSRALSFFDQKNSTSLMGIELAMWTAVFRQMLIK